MMHSVSIGGRYRRGDMLTMTYLQLIDAADPQKNKLDEITIGIIQVNGICFTTVKMRLMQWSTIGFDDLCYSTSP